MSAIDQIFDALFYGSGSWLGLLLYLSFMIPIIYKYRYGGVFTFPISISLAIAYLYQDLGMHSIIMFFISIFTMFISMIKGKDR